MSRRARPHTIAQRGSLSVERDPLRPSGRLLRQYDMEASYIDLGDPLHLEFEYLRWMRIVLRVAGARRVLHIGGAGCALARVLALEDADSRHDVCEIDPDVLELAREHLGLRRARGLRVREVDGRAFAAGVPDGSYDALVVDAFVGASVPRHLVTAEALIGAARVAPLTLVNVVDSRDGHHVRAIASGLALAYRHVWTLGVRPGNMVIAGAARQLDLEAIAARALADPAPAKLTAPERLESSLGPAFAWRDAHAGRQVTVASPAPSV